MALGDRIHEKLTSAFEGIVPAVTVRPPAKGATAGFVDVYCYPGRHDGLDWEIIVPAGYGPDKVEVGNAGIHSAEPEGTYDHVCEADEAASHKVPDSVRRLALLIQARVHESNLTELPLSPIARTLLDTLAEISISQAREDEAALAEAMESGRQIVLTYRPALANLLNPPSGGMRP